MSNYTILQRNVLDSLESEKAQAAFLWACDLKGADRFQYRAEAFAREAQEIEHFNSWGIACAADILAEQKPDLVLDAEGREDLLSFILKRHAAWRYPGIKTAYADKGACNA